MTKEVISIPVSVSVPDLWGDQQFSKAEWGGINYLVGPNGSGKTRFADQLKSAIAATGLKPRYLSAERLAGFEKHQIMGHSGALYRGFDVGGYQNYKNYGEAQGLATDAFIILKEKIDVRIRIEAFLSSLFGRRIRFAEEGGFLKPKMQRIVGGNEYEMKESECHGLKELITLLAFVYDDQFNAVIIDEPELHLHPQFQTFLLAEIRRASGDPRVDPRQKVFFLITHSPYLLDFRVLDDLRQCLLFHVGAPPTVIEQLDEQDEFVLKRLLPRLNTHHKQFFFAQRPIFVEGYTDQQIFSLIQDGRGKLLGATGACFIDVNGKDEQDFFFRLCRHLKVDAQFISDLDVITRGSFRKTVSDDERVKGYVAQQGIGLDLMDAIRQLNVKLDGLIDAIESSHDQGLSDIQAAVKAVPDTESKRYRTLVACLHNRDLLVASLPAHVGETDYAAAMTLRITEAAMVAGVHLLPKGVLENHLTSYTGSPYAVPDKVKATIFEVERDFILTNESVDIEARYAALLPILDAASGTCEVDLRRHLSYAIGVLIGNVQVAFERGEIQSVEILKQHAAIDWGTFSRILDVTSFTPNGATFECRLTLKPIVDSAETEITFTDTTSHAKFSLPQ